MLWIPKICLGILIITQSLPIHLKNALSEENLQPEWLIVYKFHNSKFLLIIRDSN